MILSFIFGNFALLCLITSEFIMTQSKKLVLHLAWFIVHVLIDQWLLYFVRPRQKGIFSGLKAWNGLNKKLYDLF